jgi:hypothetical protein
MKTNEKFNSWLYKMWNINREERLIYKDELISFEDYCNKNREWLEKLYEEEIRRGSNE